MKTWIVRFVSLYVFNVAALLVVGWLVPGVSVGWAALWAAVILTALTIWVKPLIDRIFRTVVNGTTVARKAPAKTIEYIVVLAVAAVVWVLLVVFTGVNVSGFFWGWVLGPLALLVVWAIYDAVDDAIEKRTGEVYDRATRRGAPVTDTPSASPQQRAATETGSRELKDGLTDEQRKMFDQL